MYTIYLRPRLRLRKGTDGMLRVRVWDVYYYIGTVQMQLRLQWHVCMSLCVFLRPFVFFDRLSFHFAILSLSSLDVICPHIHYHSLLPRFL